MVNEFYEYDRLIGEDSYILGAFIFQEAGTGDWDKYEVDELVEALIDPNRKNPLPQPEVIPVANYTPGRSKPVSQIIIHATGMDASGKPPTPQTVAQWFNRAQVSVHGIIGTDGAVVHYLPKTDTAWGAAGPDGDGNNVSDINDSSIQYELCGDGNIQPFTKAQYQSLVNEINYDRLHFPIKEIWGHSEKTAGKVDPGRLFDWGKLEEMLNITAEPVPDNWKQYGQTWPEIASNLLGVAQLNANNLRTVKEKVADLAQTVEVY